MASLRTGEMFLGSNNQNSRQVSSHLQRSKAVRVTAADTKSSNTEPDSHLTTEALVDEMRPSPTPSVDPYSSEVSSTRRLGSLSPDDTTTADESIAVDYRAGPTEVVVHGNNVSKIRVKFPPQPPPPDESNGSRSGRRRVRGSTEKFGRVGSAPRKLDSLPFSQEESLRASQPECNPPKATGPPADLHRRRDTTAYQPTCIPSIDTNLYTIQTGRDSLAPLGCGSLDISRTEGITLIPLSTSTDTDVERRMREGVLTGLDYFEKRNKELREIKNRLIQELDRVMRANRELEGRIDALNKRMQLAHTESEELKLKMDATEKENALLQEQARAEWTARVKAEEMYIEVKASADQEVKTLKAELDNKNTELNGLKEKLDLYARASSACDSDSKEVQVELYARVEALKEDVRRLVTENELSRDKGAKLSAEVENMKRQLVEKNAELERQFGRFLSLKKSFNDVVEENERLKSNSRCRASNVANITWPRDGENTSNSSTDAIDGGEKLHRLEFPPTANAHTIKTTPTMGGAKKRMTPVVRHRRQGSDARSTTESLPPVNKKDPRRN